MKAVLVPYTFVMMNWAAVAGLYHFALGHGDAWKDVWLKNAAPPLANKQHGLVGDSEL